KHIYILEKISLQNLFAIMAGGMLGSKWGLVSQLIYIFLGAVGLPIFAGGLSGPGVIIGPSGGYILGFLAAGYIAGFGENKFIKKLLIYSLSFMIIYILGIIGLIINTGIAFKEAFISGVFPFIPGDIFKLIIAVFLTQKLTNYNIQK
ncbi:MAG: biotin transporter BioY, partial [Halanaerobiales bacterium]